MADIWNLKNGGHSTLPLTTGMELECSVDSCETDCSETVTIESCYEEDQSLRGVRNSGRRSNPVTPTGLLRFAHNDHALTSSTLSTNIENNFATASNDLELLSQALTQLNSGDPLTAIDTLAEIPSSSPFSDAAEGLAYQISELVQTASENMNAKVNALLPELLALEQMRLRAVENIYYEQSNVNDTIFIPESDIAKIRNAYDAKAEFINTGIAEMENALLSGRVKSLQEAFSKFHEYTSLKRDGWYAGLKDIPSGWKPIRWLDELFVDLDNMPPIKGSGFKFLLEEGGVNVERLFSLAIIKDRTKRERSLLEYTKGLMPLVYFLADHYPAYTIHSNIELLSKSEDADIRNEALAILKELDGEEATTGLNHEAFALLLRKGAEHAATMAAAGLVALPIGALFGGVVEGSAAVTGVSGTIAKTLWSGAEVALQAKRAKQVAGLIGATAALGIEGPVFWVGGDALHSALIGGEEYFTLQGLIQSYLMLGTMKIIMGNWPRVVSQTLAKISQRIPNLTVPLLTLDITAKLSAELATFVGIGRFEKLIGLTPEDNLPLRAEVAQAAISLAQIKLAFFAGNRISRNGPQVIALRAKLKMLQTQFEHLAQRGLIDATALMESIREICSVEAMIARMEGFGPMGLQPAYAASGSGLMRPDPKSRAPILQMSAVDEQGGGSRSQPTTPARHSLAQLASGIDTDGMRIVGDDIAEFGRVLAADDDAMGLATLRALSPAEGIYHTLVTKILDLLPEARRFTNGASRLEFAEFIDSLIQAEAEGVIGMVLMSEAHAYADIKDHAYSVAEAYRQVITAIEEINCGKDGSWKGDKESMRVMHNSVQAIINQLENFSRGFIDLKHDYAYLLEIEGAANELKIIVRNALVKNALGAMANSVKLEIDIPDGIVIADEQTRAVIFDAIKELVHNATKYVAERSDRNIKVSYFEGVLFVRDNGIGIIDTEKIFEEHHREEHATAVAKGTGKGLFYVRESLRRVGLDIEARSKGINEGSTFVIKEDSFIISDELLQRDARIILEAADAQVKLENNLTRLAYGAITSPDAGRAALELAGQGASVYSAAAREIFSSLDEVTEVARSKDAMRIVNYLAALAESESRPIREAVLRGDPIDEAMKRRANISFVRLFTLTGALYKYIDEKDLTFVVQIILHNRVERVTVHLSKFAFNLDENTMKRSNPIKYMVEDSGIQGQLIQTVRSAILLNIVGAPTFSSLQIEVPEDLRIVNRFHIQTVCEALGEVIANSVKYGGGDVRIFWEAERNALIVEDKGIGIKDPSAIFDGVREAHAEATASGTGLGLRTQRETLRAIGWDMIAESEGEGKGSRFLITPKDGDIEIIDDPKIFEGAGAVIGEMVGEDQMTPEAIESINDGRRYLANASRDVKLLKAILARALNDDLGSKVIIVELAGADPVAREVNSLWKDAQALLSCTDRREYWNRLVALVHQRWKEILDPLPPDQNISNETLKYVRASALAFTILNDIIDGKISKSRFANWANDDELRRTMHDELPHLLATPGLVAGSLTNTKARRVSRAVLKNVLLLPKQDVNSISGFITAIAAWTELSAAMYGILLRTDIRSDLGACDQGMYDQLYPAVSELIANAIKRADSSKPEKLITIGSRDGALVVEDNGIGFDPQNAERIFEEGFREAGVSDPGGVTDQGLGLSYVRERLSKIGWTIRAESEGRGKGARFILTPPKSGGSNGEGGNGPSPVDGKAGAALDSKSSDIKALAQKFYRAIDQTAAKETLANIEKLVERPKLINCGILYWLNRVLADLKRGIDPLIVIHNTGATPLDLADLFRETYNGGRPHFPVTVRPLVDFIDHYAQRLRQYTLQRGAPNLTLDIRLHASDLARWAVENISALEEINGVPEVLPARLIRSLAVTANNLGALTILRIPENANDFGISTPPVGHDEYDDFVFLGNALSGAGLDPSKIIRAADIKDGFDLTRRRFKTDRSGYADEINREIELWATALTEGLAESRESLIKFWKELATAERKNYPNQLNGTFVDETLPRIAQERGLFFPAELAPVICSALYSEALDE